MLDRARTSRADAQPALSQRRSCSFHTHLARWVLAKPSSTTTCSKPPRLAPTLPPDPPQPPCHMGTNQRARFHLCDLARLNLLDVRRSVAGRCGVDRQPSPRPTSPAGRATDAPLSRLHPRSHPFVPHHSESRLPARAPSPVVLHITVLGVVTALRRIVSFGFFGSPCITSPNKFAPPHLGSLCLAWPSLHHTFRHPAPPHVTSHLTGPHPHLTFVHLTPHRFCLTPHHLTLPHLTSLPPCLATCHHAPRHLLVFPWPRLCRLAPRYFTLPHSTSFHFTALPTRRAKYRFAPPRFSWVSPRHMSTHRKSPHFTPLLPTSLRRLASHRMAPPRPCSALLFWNGWCDLQVGGDLVSCTVQQHSSPSGVRTAPNGARSETVRRRRLGVLRQALEVVELS